MNTDPSSPEDKKRVEALRMYGILDSLPESDYEDITQLASQICQTPIALISFVDEHRQWFKSNRGLTVRQTLRQHSFCAHNLVDPLSPMIIEDARLDERFAGNPLVTGDPHIVFYAGIPLIDPDGVALGSLCVLDEQVRQLTDGQVSALKILSGQVIKLLALRKANQQLSDQVQQSRTEAQQQTQLRLDQDLARRYLEMSQRQLLSLFEQSPVGIAIIDQQQLTFQLANPFYGQLVDRAPAQLVGKSLLEVLPELDGQGFDELLRQVIATGVPYIANEVAMQLMRNDQLETIYVDLTYQPRRDMDTSAVSGVFMIATDVTQQVKARQALQAEQQRLSTILRELPVGVLIANPDGELIYGNPSVERIFRHPFRVGQDIEAYKNWQLFDPLTDEPFPLESMPMVRSLLKGETVVGVEMKLRRGDGSWGYASVNTVPIVGPQGEIELGVAAFVDITERRHAEQALRQSEGHLRAVLESITDGLYIGGAEGITLANQAALEQLGFTSAAELNRNIGTLADEVQTRDWETGMPISIENQAFIRALGGEHVVQDVRIRHRLSGQERVVRCAASPVVVEGQVVAAVAINTDVTSQRQAEEALRQSKERYRQLTKELEERVQQRTYELTQANQDLKRSNENLQQFAYIASHDLQEPLRKIQSFSSLLTEQLNEQLTESARDHLRRITSAGARMSTLIKDLLAYSRIATRQQAFGLVSLDAIVADVLTTLDWAISRGQAQVTVEKLPVVKGDELQLSQLFQNLISNALKFTLSGQPPCVLVTSRVVSRQDLPPEVRPTSQVSLFYQISVRDEGIGFDIRYLDRIFQVFQRLHGKNDFAGTGVGLAICLRVAENHGGGITALSAPGKGATFSIYLPV